MLPIQKKNWFPHEKKSVTSISIYDLKYSAKFQSIVFVPLFQLDEITNDQHVTGYITLHYSYTKMWKNSTCLPPSDKIQWLRLSSLSFPLQSCDILHHPHMFNYCHQFYLSKSENGTCETRSTQMMAPTIHLRFFSSDPRPHMNASPDV